MAYYTVFLNINRLAQESTLFDNSVILLLNAKQLVVLWLIPDMDFYKILHSEVRRNNGLVSMDDPSIRILDIVMEKSENCAPNDRASKFYLKVGEMSINSIFV